MLLNVRSPRLPLLLVTWRRVTVMTIMLPTPLEMCVLPSVSQSTLPAQSFTFILTTIL